MAPLFSQVSKYFFTLLLCKRLSLLLLSIPLFYSDIYAQEINRKFEPYQLKTDIDVLREAMTQLHPGLYRYNSKKRIDSLFSLLYSAARKPLQEKEFYLLVAKFTAQLRCGHTYLNPLNLEENIVYQYMPKTVFPFCTRILNNRLIITHNLSEDTTIKAGTEIIAINHHPFLQVRDSLLQVSRTDGLNGRAKQLTNLEILPPKISQYTLFDIFFPLFFTKDNPIEYTLTFSDGSKPAFTQTVRGITTTERNKRYATRYEPVPRGVKALKAAYLNDSTCYVGVGTFSFFGADDPFAKFADSVFSELNRNQNIKYLILDLRRNEGGSGAARDRLLSYVLPTDFSASRYQERRFFSYRKVPEYLVPFLGKIDDAGFVERPDSIFIKNEFGFYEDQKQRFGNSGNFRDFAVKPNRFTGQVFLLTSPVNSSAGFEFAWVFQQYKAGVIVGEPTGGTKQGINGGNYFFLRLPYSRIEVDLPFIYQAHPGEPDEGVFPDIMISQTPKGIREGKDVQLEGILSKIAGARN